MRHRHVAALTLIEVVLGAMVMAVAIAAILGAYMGQLALSEHARNLSLANSDATRVIEAIRQRNSPCVTAQTGPAPTAKTPVGTNWNTWLADAGVNGGGGGSLPAALAERIMVTCRSADNAGYCAQSQIGTGEWNYAASSPAVTQDPIRVTVAVCWRHRNRVLGECQWNAGASTWNTATEAGWDGAVAYPGTDLPNVIDSPAMVSTLVVCRSQQ